MKPIGLKIPFIVLGMNLKNIKRIKYKQWKIHAEKLLM